MPEQIFTFSDEELARMLKSGQMRLLTAPEPTQAPVSISDHEKALEKAKRLFGNRFEDVETLQIGGWQTPFQLQQKLRDSDVYLSSWSNKILENLDPSPLKSKNLEIIRLRVLDLGITTFKQAPSIFRRAQELGLNLCPAEVGFQLALQDENMSMDTDYFIGMNPIPVADFDCETPCRLFLKNRGAWEIYCYFMYRIFDPSDKLIFHL